MIYRNKKLTESARNAKCVSCGNDDGTVVWAHSNKYRHGKGRGIKAHDLFGCYLCYQCHTLFDNGKMPPYTFQVESIDDWFLVMWERSMIIACEKDYLV